MKIIDKTWRLQERVEEKTKYVGKGKYGRVLKMSRKPDGEELKKTLQITGMGIILVGGLGFLVYWLWVIFPVYLRGWLNL